MWYLLFQAISLLGARPEKQLKDAEFWINMRPRKTLDYLSPYEFFGTHQTGVTNWQWKSEGSECVFWVIVLGNNDNTNKTLYMLYQTKLSPSDKFDLLLKSVACQVHGAITSLANEFSLSRKTLYSVRDSILNLFKEVSIARPELYEIMMGGQGVFHLKRWITLCFAVYAN